MAAKAEKAKKDTATKTQEAAAKQSKPPKAAKAASGDKASAAQGAAKKAPAKKKVQKKVSGESHQFQAETRQLLDLMIHSLYTNKEIFLRELISNASDALDRLRFEALTNPELMDESPLEIRIVPDDKKLTLTISDNGIGMSRQEVIDNIGTIAKSGTRELMQKIREGGHSQQELADLIGQFGVGFYSAFMVSDKVVLVTRRAGEETATRWVSTGDGSYEVFPAQRDSRGTTITLHLKTPDSEAGLENFTDTWVISRVVKRYSDFVAYPIILRDEHEEMEKDEHGHPKKDGKMETVVEHKTLNSMKPIWTRPASEVKDEEYNEFFKHISHDWNEPMRRMAFRAEGRIEYQSLLFIPSKAPYDLFYHAHEYGLQLYVRRVMIMDRCEDLLPRYLRFVKGVVDSSDLPLNISRQRLQEDRHITQMRRWLTRKILDTLEEMKEKEYEEYLKLYKEFGRCLKEAIGSDWDNKDRVTELLLFESSADPEKYTTLREYTRRMGADQKDIFYLTGESRSVVENSPHLEAFKERGIEVLYLTDTVDELMVQSLTEYDGKKLKSVWKGTVDLESEEEKKKKEEELKAKEEKFRALFDHIQKVLDDHVKWVRFTNRLTTSPVCLVGAEHDYSPQMERLLMKGDVGGPKQRMILEFNPEHPIVNQLFERYEKDKEDPVVKDYAQLLLGYAYLAEGSAMPERVKFNTVLSKLMADSIAA